MNMRRTISLLLVGVLCLSSASAAGVATTSEPDTYLTVERVSVAPTPPTADEEFTVFATLKNLGNSSSNYDISRVELRGGPDQNYTLHDEASPPGIVRPGKRKYVRLTGTIDDPGSYSLRLHVYGTNSGGERVHLQYATEVRVGAERPQVAIDTSDPVASTETQVNVTVANGLPADARNLRVSVDGEGVSVENPHRVRSVLTSGNDGTFQFSIRANESGRHRVTATLHYTTSDGERRMVRQPKLVEFASLSKRIGIDAKSAADRSAVSVTVTNFGNVPVTDMVVQGDSPNATLADAPIPKIEPGASETVMLNISRFESDGGIPVEVTANYDAGTATGSANTSVKIASNPGTIRLTGIEVEQTEGKTHISGSASNVGLTDANSVIVSVVPTDGVDPAHPNKEYFVGTVPSSDFVSFDVFAKMDENVSAVPLKVSFLVDGERRTYTVTVEYEGEDSGSQVSAQSTDDLVLPVAVGSIVTLGVGAIIVVAWRNSRDGT